MDTLRDDLMTAIALGALIYFAWRSVSVDLSSFGTGVLAIFGGHAARSYGNAQEKS
jgi:hypothetical protein